MENKIMADGNGVIKYNMVYKNKKTNIYRAFINLPTWVGMKAFEITSSGSKVTINVLAQCAYQSENAELSKLYHEVKLHKRDEWAFIDSAANFIECIECINKICPKCPNFKSIESRII